jgi:hypothetical protein
MPEIKSSPVWYPPQFPLQGRLPGDEWQVQQNLLRQCREERDYHSALCVAAGRRLTRPCCKSLHISLFFDGTGNNLKHDLFQSEPPHPTNIVRLFRASVGVGHTGGAGEFRGLTDEEGSGNGEYFKYYMPGVGTPFPEIEDLDFSTLGMAFGAFGEERINWGLLMIIDALRRALGLPRLDDVALLAAIRAMSTRYGVTRLQGKRVRAAEFRKQLKALEKPLRIALQQPSPGQPKLLGLKLFVYGFSRGAASARAFVTWLNELMQSTPYLTLGDLQLPISVEYLGILDTVASVGLADIAPVASGHAAWADNTQPLPRSGLVKRCLHLMASHEQRLCFPAESIRREDGSYPANCVEVIYPGVHSDVGGGYPPGDQGKAFSGGNMVGDGLLLSQIALHDLYADAFAHGAPLKVPEESLPAEARHDLWRVMGAGLVREFAGAPPLINRFNAWRQITLGQEPSSQSSLPEHTERYAPITASISLEQAMRAQVTWLTAWRIGRYAFGSLKTTPFYLRATDTQAELSIRTAAEAGRDREQAEIEKLRLEQQARERDSRYPKKLLPAGVKDFDADMAQTQLREAAEEFRLAYHDPDPLSSAQQRIILPKYSRWVLLYMVPDDARAEALQMRSEGYAKVPQLFPPPAGALDPARATLQGNMDEQRNTDQPTGWLRALFDDQVHDSRAWFLYPYGREPRGSYFRERMVFFGDVRRKALALLIQHEAELVALAEQAQGPLMDARGLAQVHQALDTIWDEFYAKRAEAKNAPA